MLYCATSSVDATGGPFSEGYRQAGRDGEHARCSPCDHLRHPRRPRHPVCYRAAAEQVSQESAEQHAPQGWNGEFWFVWFGLVWFGDHPPTTGDVVCGTCTCANSARLPPPSLLHQPLFFCGAICCCSDLLQSALDIWYVMPVPGSLLQVHVRLLAT